jgi:DNA-binding IclR family transcriptional regulator
VLSRDVDKRSSIRYGRSVSSVRVIEKAAQVLEALADEGELGVHRLAELTGEPRSTVYRLLLTLRRLGFVTSGSRRGTYKLGLTIFRLGSAAREQFDIRTAALPIMRALNDETAESCYLYVLSGDQAVCIERLDGRWVEPTGRVGGAVPLHVGAGPKVLLAYQSFQFQTRYLEGELQPLTEHTVYRPAELASLLEAIRRRGFAQSDGDVVLGRAAIGAPVFDHAGAVLAAISLAGPRETILQSGAEVCDRLVNAAEEISFRLGYREGVIVATTA